MIVAPASKVERYAAQLGDRSVVLSELELQRIVADCKKLLRDPNSTESPLSLQSLIGGAYTRLGSHDEALGWYRRALALARNVPTLTNFGVGMMNVGCVEDAVTAWVDGIELLKKSDGSAAVILFGNLAEGLMGCGSVTDAWAALQEAVKRADMFSTFDTFILAQQAAELGADREATEFFARYVAVKQGVAIGHADAPTFLRSFSPEIIGHAFGAASDNMRAAVLRTVGALKLTELPRYSGETAPGDLSLLEEAFEATSPLRAAANHLELSEHAG